MSGPKLEHSLACLMVVVRPLCVILSPTLSVVVSLFLTLPSRAQLVLQTFAARLHSAIPDIRTLLAKRYTQVDRVNFT